MFPFKRRGEDRFLPEDFAADAVKTGEDARLRLLGGVLNAPGQVDAIPPDDRRRVAIAGEFGFPDDVLARTPLHRKAGLASGAVAARTAPGGPVFALGGISGE